RLSIRSTTSFGHEEQQMASARAPPLSKIKHLANDKLQRSGQRASTRLRNDQNIFILIQARPQKQERN
ncbi:MAG: hypothetical protein Q9226_009143, partial [Calogaya cf. arnoldii]